MGQRICTKRHIAGSSVLIGGMVQGQNPICLLEGTPEAVLAEASRQVHRHRTPGVTWREIRNPRKAIQAALAALGGCVLVQVTAGAAKLEAGYYWLNFGPNQSLALGNGVFLSRDQYSEGTVRRDDGGNIRVVANYSNVLRFAQ